MEHCWINQNAKLSLGYFDKGRDIQYSFNPTNKCLFIFVMEGSIQIGDNKVERRNGLGIWDTGSITIHCTEESHFLLIETPVNQK